MSSNACLAPTSSERQTFVPLECLVALSEEQLGRLDIALVNLSCAAGLPGAEKIDVAYCLNTLDAMAERVREITNPAVFRQHPKK